MVKYVVKKISEFRVVRKWWENTRFSPENAKNKAENDSFSALFGLSDKTWTCGLYHPKVARYQLRHTQINQHCHENNTDDRNTWKNTSISITHAAYQAQAQIKNTMTVHIWGRYVKASSEQTTVNICAMPSVSLSAGDIIPPRWRYVNTKSSVLR